MIGFSGLYSEYPGCLLKCLHTISSHQCIMVLVSPWGFRSQKVVLLDFFVYIACDVSTMVLKSLFPVASVS